MSHLGVVDVNKINQEMFKMFKLLLPLRCDLGQSVMRVGRIRMPRKRVFICPPGKLHYYAIRDICDCEPPE